MPICYLHLGMPKTGSTAIQHSFRHYEDDALIYAETGAPQHGAVFKLCFSKEPMKTTSLRRRGMKVDNLAAMIADARAQIDRAAASGKNVIFSGETIPGQLKPDEMAAMFSYLREKFERVVVIAYVRPAASLVASQFQQQVKLGRGEFALPKPRYRAFFQPIVANVAPADLQLVRFHRDDLHDGDIVTDFAKRVGAARVPEQKVGENESLSAEGVAAMFAFNRFQAPSLAPVRRRKAQKLQRTSLEAKGDTKFGFSAELVEAHLKTHEADIAWMSQVAGFDVRGVFQPVQKPVGSEADLLALARTLTDSVDVVTENAGEKGGRKGGKGKTGAATGGGGKRGAGKLGAGKGGGGKAGGAKRAGDGGKAGMGKANRGKRSAEAGVAQGAAMAAVSGEGGAKGQGKGKGLRGGAGAKGAGKRRDQGTGQAHGQARMKAAASDSAGKGDL